MSDKDRVLAVIAGQFLVVALKGDNRTLAVFRKGYLAHWKTLSGARSGSDIVEDTGAAGRVFTELLGKHYGWDPDAVALLSRKVESVCRDWVSGVDATAMIENLRIVDLWSGLASCVAKRSSIPLSLLDYVVMALLPMVCAREIRKTMKALSSFMNEQGDPLRDVDASLGECVTRLCCGIELSKALERELKLVVLLHMPKDEGVLSANAGFAYKVLQRQYANEEVK